MNKKLTQMFFQIQSIAIICFLIFAFTGFSYLRILKTEQANIVANSVRESILLTDYRSVASSISQSAGTLFENVILVDDKQIEVLNLFNINKTSILNSSIAIPLFFNEHFGTIRNTMIFSYSTRFFWLSVIMSLLLFNVGGYLFFVRFRKSYLLTQETLAQWALQEKLGLLASQVAHDIRSPLSALEMISKTTKELPEERRIIIRDSVSRIRDIANDLLNQNRAIAQGKANAQLAEEKPSIELIQSLLDPLLTEKRLQFRSKLDIEILGEIDSAGYGLFAEIQPIEFKRVLSNLINNSVEAFSGAGAVTIVLRPEANSILIEIIDNGKGIPPAILTKLGARGETHGKEGGSGLGFYHAKKTVKAWGGQLTIASEVGKGTMVTITLPKANIPNWFVPKILLRPYQQIVVLDDDSSIHQVWNERFDSFSVQVHHLSTEQEMTKWRQEQSGNYKDVVYLVDYELLGQKKTGLDIIEAVDIAKKAILVTSRYEEANIRGRCEALGIKMIPKGLAGYVPIEIIESKDSSTSDSSYEKCDCVLIDDSPMVRAVWNMAGSENDKIVRTFNSPQSFFENAHAVDPKTPLYIDSELGENILGQNVAKEIFEKYGFTEIYLATGYEASKFDLSNMPYIKAIKGKDNPWV